MIPLDVEPVDDGNIVLGRDDDGPVAMYLRKDETTTRDRYVSHFATCPHAAEHRKR